MSWPRALPWLAGAGLACASPLALAHTAHASPTPAQVWNEWNLSPSIVLPLLVAATLYGLGTARLWRRAGIGRGLPRAAAAAYAAGMLALVVALVSPLDAAGGALFSLHMVQHLVLILVAAPLLVLGAPDVAMLWALPARWRGGFGRFERWVGRHVASDGRHNGPLLITLLATGVLWLWHVPALYDLAVQDDAIHYAEHLSFLVTALLFWASVLRLRPRDHAGNGLRILYVFAMAIQGSILGALITLASRPLYRSYLDSSSGWGLSVLEDQQLAGLIMWVPPALLYIGLIAYLFTRWLSAVAERDRRTPGRAGN